MYLHPTKGYRGSFTTPRGTNKRRYVTPLGKRLFKNKRVKVARIGF